MKGFRLYCLLSALGILVGESWFVFTTNKFPPLWLDDYFIALVMLWSTGQWQKPYAQWLIFGCWMFILGNLYAMLFTRLEPINPEGRPWKLLAVLVVWAGLSCMYTLYRARKLGIIRPY